MAQITAPLLPYLNLLAPDDRRETWRSKWLLLLHEICLFLFIFIALGSAGLLAARILLEQKFQQTVLETIPGSQEVALINRDIRVLNRQLSNLDRAIKNYRVWSPLLIEISQTAPEGIRYDLVQFNESGTIFMRGQAIARDDLILLKETLKKSPNTKELKIPLQDLAQQNDILFSIERIVDPESI